MTKDRYPEIWNTIAEKLDKVCEENDNQELILVGGYNRAELAFGYQGAAILLDEYLEGNYDDLDIDREDTDNQVEQMEAEIKKGCRFGDYQEIISFATRLEEFQKFVSETGVSPAYLYGSVAYSELTRVRINGREADLSQKITHELESLRELDDYLEELEELENTWY